MDAQRFDRLTLLLATRMPRRAALGGLAAVGAAVLGQKGVARGLTTPRGCKDYCVCFDDPRRCRCDCPRCEAPGGAR